MYNFYGENYFRLERKGHADGKKLIGEITDGIVERASGEILSLDSEDTNGVIDLTVKSSPVLHRIILRGDQKAISRFTESFKVLN